MRLISPNSQTHEYYRMAFVRELKNKGMHTLLCCFVMYNNVLEESVDLVNCLIESNKRIHKLASSFKKNAAMYTRERKKKTHRENKCIAKSLNIWPAFSLYSPVRIVEVLICVLLKPFFSVRKRRMSHP